MHTSISRLQHCFPTVDFRSVAGARLSDTVDRAVSPILKDILNDCEIDIVFPRATAMNILRRRRNNAIDDTSNGNSNSNDNGNTNTALPPQTPSNDHTDFRILPAQKLQEIITKPKGQKRQKAWIFGLGGIFGLVVAALLAANQNQMLDLAALGDINLESLVDVLPAGILRDARDFQVNILFIPTRSVKVRKEREGNANG